MNDDNDDQSIEEFFDDIDLYMNDNDYDQLNKEFFDNIDLNINDDDNKFVINH